MDQLFVALIVGWLLVSLILTRWPVPWIFSSSMLACYLLGLVDTETVLAKAANEGVLTLVLLMLVSVGLERLPWLSVLSQRLLVPSQGKSILRLSALTTVFSAFVNNTAVVATLASTVRKSRHHSPSRLLLPLSYAAILGGTLTLIGTSTNLIVSSFLQDATGTGLRFFAFLPVALPAVVAGVAAMFIFRKRLPDKGKGGLQIDDYLIEAEVMNTSRLIGKTIQENGLRDLGELFLVELVRGDQLLSPVAPSQRIEAGDKLIFSGDVTRVGHLERFSGLRLFAVDQGLLSSNMTEAIIMPNAAVAGLTIKESLFRARFDAAVVGLKRDGERLSGKLGAIRLQPGDSLMLAVGPDFAQRSNLNKNFLIVDNAIDTSSLSLGKSSYLTLAFILCIALAGVGLMSLLKGLGFMLAVMLVLGVVSGSDLRRRFPFEMWLIITSALTVSQALTNTGLIELAVTGLDPLLANVPPLVAIIMVYAITLLLTELMTNNAAAALMFPLAYTLALRSGVDPMAFVMAVAFGASASFLTPFGYTTNLMVQNLGGYRRADYLRFGTPVSIVYSVVVLTLIPIVFPLTG